MINLKNYIMLMEYTQALKIIHAAILEGKPYYMDERWDSIDSSIRKEALKETEWVKTVIRTGVSLDYAREHASVTMGDVA